ncbi:MAG: flagellar basal body-associated FliL family protein [Symbiobacteriia bacterium]
MKAVISKVGLIILAAVLIVGAASGATYFAVRTALGKPAEAAAKPAAKVQLKALQAQEFLTNLADPSGRAVIHIKVEMMVEDDKIVTKLNADTAAIRDQVLRILRSKSVSDLSGEAGFDNLENEIKNRLNVAVADGKIRELYLTDFAVQR